MTFDFGGAKFDPVKDREILGFTFNQFLYGEVTGIQVGHWIYGAPDLDAAKFLARQAIEEFQHVDNFLRIMTILDLEPKPANRVVRFLATDMMGASWEEHVALEMAMAEGFVLTAIYGLIDTIDHPEVVAILERASKQEERHVAFGEQMTKRAIEGRPGLRRRLLGLNLVSMWAVARLASFMQTRLPAHPVLQQMPGFLAKTLEQGELRLRRMGLLDRPIAELGRAKQLALVAEAYGGKAIEGAARSVLALLRALPIVGGVFGRTKRLTDTYLEDPHVRALRTPTSDDLADPRGAAE